MEPTYEELRDKVRDLEGLNVKLMNSFDLSQTNVKNLRYLRGLARACPDPTLWPPGDADLMRRLCPGWFDSADLDGERARHKGFAARADIDEESALAPLLRTVRDRAWDVMGHPTAAEKEILAGGGALAAGPFTACSRTADLLRHWLAAGEVAGPGAADLHALCTLPGAADRLVTVRLGNQHSFCLLFAAGAARCALLQSYEWKYTLHEWLSQSAEVRSSRMLHDGEALAPLLDAVAEGAVGAEVARVFFGVDEGVSFDSVEAHGFDVKKDVKDAVLNDPLTH
jgi:hypothetical protein